MRIKATKKYTDRELGREIRVGEEFTVLRKRGLQLIKNDFARLISDDDISTEQENEKDKYIAELTAKVEKYVALLHEKDRQIDELMATVTALQSTGKKK